jgi:microcystin-dependent protein
MAEPFLSEIRIMSFNFPPKGWAQCNGQLLPINQNQALFSLLGTTYGGNGTVNFALPNLRGRVPIHVGGGHTLGEQGGESAHTLSVSELPAHTHQLYGTTASAGTNSPATALAAHADENLYSKTGGLIAMDTSAVGLSGGSQPHENRQPYLTLNFCIALQGIFPSQT